MKIIKYGDLERLKQTNHFICEKCGCEFIAESREVEYSEEVSWGPDHNEYRCKCPCCGEECRNRIY